MRQVVYCGISKVILEAGVGAARVHIGASSLLQRQPAHVAVAAVGHKDVIVHFCYRETVL